MVRECDMRISEKPMHKYPWYLRLFFWNQERKYGQVLKPALLWARVPKLFLAVSILYGVLNRPKSPIDPILRSLVMVRVSQISWCPFCVDINASLFAERAGSSEKSRALERWRESEIFSKNEKAVLDYAEAITCPGQKVSDDLIARLRDFFDEDGIVELTGLVAFQTLSSKFNNALDIPSQGFCQIQSLLPKVD
jgi:AhpD family alkylhydroperoxidase